MDKDLRVKRYDGKTIDQLKSIARRWVNKYVQLRDLEKTPSGDILARCISCKRWWIITGPYMPKDFHAGHYFKEDRHESVRYNHVNINGQCSYCNRRLSGNGAEYHDGLIMKYGQSAYDKLVLEKNQIEKYTHSELVEIIICHIKLSKERIKELDVSWLTLN